MSTSDVQWERRIAHLEQRLAEAIATGEGYRLALKEAERRIAELTRMREAPAEAKTRDPSRQAREGDKKGKTNGESK